MTPDEFRRLALSMPDAVEHAHMNHPDFRVGKKIFATLGYPDGRSAMVKLKPYIRIRWCRRSRKYSLRRTGPGASAAAP